MEKKLFDAAQSGNVEMVHQLFKENPSTLSTCTLDSSWSANPLTVAIKANRLLFAQEILKLSPELGLKLDQDGVRPLDVASACGNVEIVRWILASSGPESCQLQGKDGRTAIHYAATTEVINELLSACPDCAKDVTSFGETALHLAVKYYKFEQLKCLLEWLEKLGMLDLVNSQDREGNTVLHYAASRKQLKAVEVLLEWNEKPGNSKLEVNAMNKKGLTPTNIIDIIIDSSNDIHLREILLRSGGISSSHFRVVTEQPEPGDNHVTTNNEIPKTWEDILEHFEFKWHRDSPGEARETLLIIVALVATVTFQAGVTPPGPLSRSIPAQIVFFSANSLAFSIAGYMIMYLTTRFPFERELTVAMYAMMFAYGCAVGSSLDGGYRSWVIVSCFLFIPMALRFKSYCSC